MRHMSVAWNWRECVVRRGSWKLRVPCGRVTRSGGRGRAGPCLGGRYMHSDLLVLPLPPVFLESHRSSLLIWLLRSVGCHVSHTALLAASHWCLDLKQLSQQPRCNYEKRRSTSAWYSGHFFLFSLCIDNFFKLFFLFKKATLKMTENFSPVYHKW